MDPTRAADLKPDNILLTTDGCAKISDCESWERQRDPSGSQSSLEQQRGRWGGQASTVDWDLWFSDCDSRGFSRQRDPRQFDSRQRLVGGM